MSTLSEKMTDHASKTQHYTFVNAAKMASKAFQGKPVTLMGKVDKVASSSEFTLRSTDGKFTTIQYRLVLLCGKSPY